MKTIFAHLNINNNGINQSIATKSSFKNLNYYQDYDLAGGDVNKNANVSQVEHERDACEKELYRLRYGIENLLANKDQGDFKREQQQQKRFSNIQNPFRKQITQIKDLNNKINTNWIDQCTPCCRRWRRVRRNSNINSPNQYSNRQMHKEKSFDRSLPKTPKSSGSSQFNRDLSISNSPSHHIDSDGHRSKFNLKRSVSKLINGLTPNKMNPTNLFRSNDMNDPLYNALILKILEAKALDCLCTGYSKRDTEKQISKALAEIDQRISRQQLDSISVRSTKTSPLKNSVNDPESNFSQLITPQLLSEKIMHSSPSDTEIPYISATTSKSSDNNKDKIKSALKLNETIKKKPKKKSKVTIIGDKRSKSRKSMKKKRPSSKHRQKPKQKHKPTSTRKNRSKSKTSNKKRSSSKVKKSRFNKFYIMRLLSIFSLFVFCLSLLMIDATDHYQVQASGNDCQQACFNACEEKCPGAPCDYPSTTFVRSKTSCVRCFCPEDILE
ncbi:unnamed protein product [Rotaria socialis]|uniref:Uncharacterized protein n=1 Tax=Rotaria socialis TaxID=392032 RepID=A0A819ASG2_9BILA|nr:unnamed protein product [Rotaria socialis]CAF3784548.1 unnamed protein product [Rotaria socialis]